MGPCVIVNFICMVVPVVVAAGVGFDLDALDRATRAQAEITARQMHHAAPPNRH